jgi:hypothetical protein
MNKVRLGWENIRYFYIHSSMLIIPAMVVLFALIPIVGDTLTKLIGNWAQIPAPPAAPERILGADIFGFYAATLYVQAEDGNIYSLEILDWNIYSLDIRENASWVTNTIEIDQLVKEKCDLSSIKFYFWKRPFSEPFDCVKIGTFGEFVPAPDFNVVLDQDRQIWLWADRSSTFLFFPCACISAIVGFGIGVILSVIRFWKSKANPYFRY